MKKSAIFFGIVEAILFFALAIFLVAAPASALNLIITLGGILLIASGIIIFIYYFTSSIKPTSLGQAIEITSRPLSTLLISFS